MRSNTSKWLMGCGIGCSVILALIILVVASGYFFVKDKIGDFKEIEITLEKLEDEFGDAQDFTPEPEGIINPDRIETFLEVREKTEFARNNITDHLRRFSKDIEDVQDEGESFWNVMNLVKKGLGIIPKMVEYYKDRNEILLEEGIGIGEYYYIYTLAYYSWLKKPLDDGPKFPLMGGKEFKNFDWRNFEEDYNDYEEFGDDVRDKRERRIIRKIHRVIIPMLERQLEELLENGNKNNSWRDALEKEIQLLDEDSRRIPWEDGLPTVLKDSFQPFRDRFETSYNAMVNPLELGGNN